MPIDVELESLDGNVRKTVSLFTTKKGHRKLIEAIDSGKYASKWPNRRGIQFPKPGPQPVF